MPGVVRVVITYYNTRISPGGSDTRCNPFPRARSGGECRPTRKRADPPRLETVTLIGMSDPRRNVRSAGAQRRRFGRSLRTLGTELDRLDEAVADRFGLHRTDLRCLEIVGRERAISAGRLATLAGLSTSAVTAVIDRTERIGDLRRSADPEDRRRVLVVLTEQGRERGRIAFAGLMNETERLLSRYSAPELELLADVLERIIATVGAQAEIAVREAGHSRATANRLVNSGTTRRGNR